MAYFWDSAVHEVDENRRPSKSRGVYAADGSRRFRGHRASASSSALVVVEDATSGAVLGPLLHESRYSPTGFNWGYDGAGPRELARALLVAVSSGRTAESKVPDVAYTREVIRHLDATWLLTEQDIVCWWNEHATRDVP